MLNIEKVRPVWAEINLDYLRHNIREIRKKISKETLICAVVKADAYGHGARMVSKVLLENGADRLAVGTLSEAIELRRDGCTAPIMILGYTPIVQVKSILEHNIISAVYTYEQACEFSKIAVNEGKTMKLHIKIDTGMSRLGFQVEDKDIQDIKKIFNLPNLEIEGIFTHFAVADEGDKSFTIEQFNKFNKVIRELESSGYNIPIKHASNSAATMDLKEMNLDMIRPGIILYGLYPSQEVKKEVLNIKPVMQLKAKISHVKNLPKNRGVSYGLKYITDEEKKIATIPVGYADGFTRMLTDEIEVLIKGKKVPIVGRICMDQCMADVTGLDVRMGDEVILISNIEDSGNTFDDIAMKLGTINYEVISTIGRRVPRAYVENNKIIHIHDNLLD